MEVWDCGVGSGLAQRLNIAKRSKVRYWSRTQLQWVLYLHILFLSSFLKLPSDSIHLEAHPWPNWFSFPRWSWPKLKHKRAAVIASCSPCCHLRKSSRSSWATSTVTSPVSTLPNFAFSQGESMKHPGTDPYLCGSGLGNSRRYLLL